MLSYQVYVVMVCPPFTAAVPGRRHFQTDFLEVGAPNLLVTTPGVYLCVCMCACVCGVFENPEIVKVYKFDL